MFKLQQFQKQIITRNVCYSKHLSKIPIPPSHPWYVPTYTCTHFSISELSFSNEARGKQPLAGVHAALILANLTARPSFSYRRQSPSEVAKITGHRLKRKSLNIHSHTHTQPHFSSWYFLITAFWSPHYKQWKWLSGINYFLWSCSDFAWKGGGLAQSTRALILFSGQRYFNIAFWCYPSDSNNIFPVNFRNWWLTWYNL